MNQSTHLFSHIFLVLRLGLESIFRPIHADTSLPAQYGDFRRVAVIKSFPCGIGIYENNSGEQVLLKIWRGSTKTYEYYQFLKEVRLYELLHRVLGRVGSAMGEKYRRVRIPRLLEKNISDREIVALFEYVKGSTHLKDVSSMMERQQLHDLAIGFWRYIGNFLTPDERLQLPRRNLVDTLFTYAVVLTYAFFRYPRRIPELLRTLSMVVRAVPLLKTGWREELIHRDFHFENILVSDGGITIIDFGDNALTHPLQVFVNSLHWEWDNPESRDIILNSIVSSYGRSVETDRIFRALFAISCVQLLHDVGSKKRLDLNFRCFEAVVAGWDDISATLSGRTETSALKLSVGDRFMQILRNIRAPIMRFLKPISRYVLLGRSPSLEPLSTKYGFDRGTPIDRYYIDKFLSDNRQRISGRCLEIHDSFYTAKFGGGRVIKSDVLDLHTGNKSATIYGNLKSIPHVEDNIFDCIILTQTLGMIDDCQAAVRECYRILKPGGTLLFTSKAMGPVLDPEGSYWKFTTAGIKYLLGLSFSEKKLRVGSYGNILSGQAFWVGMATEELTAEQLDYNDPRYEIIITAVAEK